MFKVKTKLGVTHNYVKSWKKWDLNNDFIEFTWIDDKVFIIHFNDISSIESR